MQVYVVINKKSKPWAVYVFDNHADALACRLELGIDSHWLWGTSLNCYKK